MRNLTTTELAAAFKDATPTHGDRRVERTVTLHEGDDGTTAAVLSVMHHKEARAIMTHVKIIRQEPPREGSVFTVTTWIPFERTHNRRLPNLPVARYSAKALANADAEALELLNNEPDWLDSLDLGPYQGSL